MRNYLVIAMPPQDVPTENAQSENVQPQDARPTFIPKNCLRLNSPHMLQLQRDIFSLEDKTKHVLKPFDPTHHFDTIKSSLGQNSNGQRIKDDEILTQWLAPTHRQLRAQICGGTKIDRTSAAFFVVDRLQGLQSSSLSKKTQVLYFFCHRSDRQRSTASAVLNGWIYQLVQRRPDLTKEFCEWLLQDPIYVPSYLDKARMMWAFLRRAAKLSNAGITYCLLDGLDECGAESRALILELLDLTLPYEGCPEMQPTLKFLVTTRIPLDVAKYGNVDLDARTGSVSMSSTMGSLTAEEHISSLSQKYSRMGFIVLQVLAAYLCPPTTGQLLSMFPESQRTHVLEFLDSRPTELLISSEHIGLADSDAWLALSQSSLAEANNAKLARQCLELIDAGLAQIDMADLENDEFIWVSQVPTDLKYAVNHWAEHIKPLKDIPQDLGALIEATFCSEPTVLEKWWIMFMTWNYGISPYHDVRKHHTTLLHVYALFGLDKLIEAPSSYWLLVEYMSSLDAQMLAPVDVAILHNHIQTVKSLATTFEFSGSFSCILAAGSSVKIADPIHSRHGPTDIHLTKEQIEAVLWNAVCTGKPEMLDGAIKFVFVKSSGDLFPWNKTLYAEVVIDSGEYQLLKHILTTVNMQEKAGHLIEYATWQHEPRMLEEILDYEVVREMIRHNQIDLREALNNALFRRNPRMTEMLLSEKTMNFLALVNNPRPLEWAVKHPNVHTLMVFLAQPNFRFDKGAIEEGIALNLMLHNAGQVSGVGLDTLSGLLKRGARMRYEDFGMTALHVAAEIGRMPVMKTLLDNLTEDEIKEDIDRRCSRAHRSQGREGMTALAIAALTGRLEIVQCLLAKGADIDVEDKKGKTAVQLARETGRVDIADTILDS